MTEGTGPINTTRLQLMTKILTAASQEKFRTRDLVRLSRTASPEIKPSAQQLQDLIIREVKLGNLDFTAVAKQGADLVEATQAEISTLQTELAKRPTLKDIEDRQKEIGTLRLADDVLRGRITRRERTIEVLQQREVGYLERIERLEAEVTRLSPLEEKTRSLEAENIRLNTEIRAKTDELAASRSDKDFAHTESEDTEVALKRAFNENKELRANLEAARQLVTEYREQIDRLTQSGEVVETQSGTLRGELDAAKRKVFVLERSLAEAKVQKLQSNAEAEATLAQRTRERDTERETAKDLQARLTTTGTRLAQMISFEQIAARAEAENSALRQASVAMEAAHSQTEREKQREIDGLHRELNGRDDRIDELQRESQRLNGLLAAGLEFYGRSETTDGRDAHLTLTSGELLSSGVKDPNKK